MRITLRSPFVLFAVPLALAGATPLLAVYPASSPPTLYGIAELTNETVLIAPWTGAAEALGDLGLDASNGDLAYDSSTDTLYASDLTTSDFLSTGLASIDRRTGAATFIGDHGGSINVAGLAYVAGADTLYGADMESNSLVTVDRATGALSMVGPFGTTGMRDLAYNPSTDILYGVDGASLFAISRATGHASFIGSLGAAFGVSNPVSALAFDRGSHLLYAGDCCSLYTVDTITGLATRVGGTGRSGLGAIEFGPQIHGDGFESGALQLWSGALGGP
jgi:hypothetical protein